MAFSNDDIHQLADLIAERLLVSPDHEDHHRWIEQQIKQEQERKEMRRKVLTSTVAWALPLAISFFVIAVWKEIRLFIINGG